MNNLIALTIFVMPNSNSKAKIDGHRTETGTRITITSAAQGAARQKLHSSLRLTKAWYGTTSYATISHQTCAIQISKN